MHLARAPEQSTTPQGMNSRWLRLFLATFKALPFLFLAALLFAGLYPFDFVHHNDVAWLANKGGLRFGDFGEVHSESAWALPPAPEPLVTLELWFTIGPEKYKELGPFLSIVNSPKRRPFTIAQSITDLVLHGDFRDSQGNIRHRRFYLPEACEPGATGFFTVTSGPKDTNFYLNGTLARSFPNLVLTADNFSGQVFLGHTPVGHQPWQGQILGLALYDRTISAEEAADHFSQWKATQGNSLSTVSGAVALFPFDEKSGTRARNRVSGEPDLIIPSRFVEPYKAVLGMPARFASVDWGDVTVNILGLMPFGFVVAAYLEWVWSMPRRRAVIGAIVVGAITSLIIELLQVYLPSRDSSLLDVVDNILGSALGAGLWACLAARRSQLVERLPILKKFEQLVS
jgi:hypothetical protein